MFCPLLVFPESARWTWVWMGVHFKVNVNCEHGSGVWVWDLDGFGLWWIWVRDMVWMEMEAREWRAGGSRPWGRGASDKDERRTRRLPASDQRPASLPAKPDYNHVPALRTVPDARADSNLAFPLVAFYFNFFFLSLSFFLLLFVRAGL